MPPLPPVPGVLKVDHHYDIGSDLTALMRLHVSYSGTPPTNATCAALAHDLFTDFTTIFAPYAVSDVVFTSVAIEDLSTSSGGVGSYTGSVAGTLTGAPTAAQVAALCNAQIARRYRGGKPRSYLPLGSISTMATPQTWTSTFVTNVNAALAQYLADIAVTTEAGCNLQKAVNVSFYSGFTAVTNPITGRTRDVPKVRTGTIPVDPFISWTLNPKLGTQRRRVGLRG